MAGIYISDGESLMASSVMFSLNGDTAASPLIAPIEHAMLVDIAETDSVLSSQEGSGYTSASLLERWEGSSRMIGSEELTAEASNQAECRICQENDYFKNLETPCACCGSMKYAHKKCVQRWCSEKGDINCEICREPYKNGYEVNPLPPHTEVTLSPLDGEQGISGTHNRQDYPRLVALAAIEQDPPYPDCCFDAYECVSCLRCLIIMPPIVLLLGAMANSKSTFLMLFFGVCGVSLLCYIMKNLLRRRRQLQESSMLANAAPHLREPLLMPAEVASRREEHDLEAATAAPEITVLRMRT